jgi:hypothetical protein
MHTREEKFQYRGKTFEGEVVIFDNLEEAMLALGEQEVFDFFMVGYVDEMRRKIRLKREKKYVRVDVSKLPTDQRKALEALEKMQRELNKVVHGSETPEVIQKGVSTSSPDLIS